MSKSIAIIGNKGGTGKTSLSHMICHGLGLFGHYSVCVLTDEERDKLCKTGRNYLPFDARSPENLARVIQKLQAVQNWYGVIDGGGNRPEMDRKLAALCELVILPFRDSHEDMRTLRRDLDRFPNAYALPSQWPTNAWQQQAAWRSVDALLGDYRHRILEPVYAMSATKVLLQDQVPVTMPSQLNNACRSIAIQIMELLGMEMHAAQWFEPNTESSLCDAAIA